MTASDSSEWTLTTAARRISLSTLDIRPEMGVAKLQHSGQAALP